MKRFPSKNLLPLAALAILFASSFEKKSSAASNAAVAGAAELNPTTAAALPD